MTSIRIFIRVGLNYMLTWAYVRIIKYVYAKTPSGTSQSHCWFEAGFIAVALHGPSGTTTLQKLQVWVLGHFMSILKINLWCDESLLCEWNSRYDLTPTILELELEPVIEMIFLVIY